MMLHLDPTKPADLARLVESGLIWNKVMPVAYVRMAVDALVEGTLPYNDRIPANVLAHVNKMRRAVDMEPLEALDDALEDRTKPSQL